MNIEYTKPQNKYKQLTAENITNRVDAVNEACIAFPPTEKDEYQIITDKLRIFFVELPKFHPKHVDRKNMLDVWMAFLKNPLNDEIQNVQEIQEALDTLKEVSANEDEREIYDQRRKAEFGYISERNVAVENAHKAGKAEGKAEGIEQGRAEEREKARTEKIEMARNFLNMGLSVEQVAKGTGLSTSEIESLKNS